MPDLPEDYLKGREEPDMHQSRHVKARVAHDEVESGSLAPALRCNQPNELRLLAQLPRKAAEPVSRIRRSRGEFGADD